MDDTTWQHGEMAALRGQGGDTGWQGSVDEWAGRKQSGRCVREGAGGRDNLAVGSLEGRWRQ